MDDKFLLCSNCFSDQGLRLYSESVGIESLSDCPNCGTDSGLKLTHELAELVAHRFFVRGTFHRCEFGGSPTVMFNRIMQTDIDAPRWLRPDLRLLEKVLGIGFHYYGPRFWMLGEVGPLKQLRDTGTRGPIIQRILAEYPTIELEKSQSIYRLRKNIENPTEYGQYDSPPGNRIGQGRFDSRDFPVMYASQDLQICIHECCVTAEDDLYFATLEPTRNLKLLDLSELLSGEDYKDEFESLDMAIHMIFLSSAESSYSICRSIAQTAFQFGFDGIVYPSYFSLLRTGGMPFETVYGMSLRYSTVYKNYEKSKIISNICLFGRPIEQGLVSVKCINKLMLRQVDYDILFGPVGV